MQIVLKRNVFFITLGIIIIVTIGYLTSTCHSRKVFRSSLLLKDAHSKIAICLMMKDEDDLLEWITYHNRLGVSKFYIYDNGSQSPKETILKRLISIGLVDYEYTWGDDRWWVIFINKYITKYRDDKIDKREFIFDKCYSDHGQKHQWMSFLDADEYVVLTEKAETNDLAVFLSKFSSYSGVKFTWRTFGSSGLIKRPETVLGDNYYKCLPDNGAVTEDKTFIQPLINGGGFKRIPAHLYGTRRVYQLIVNNTYEYVNPAKQRYLDGNGNPLRSFEYAYLNHYQLKSREDYERKVKRGSGNDCKKTEQYWQQVEALATETCPFLHMPFQVLGLI
jgi:hypothetical protein